MGARLIFCYDLDRKVHMIRSWTTLGTVLKRSNFGEADRLLVLYTKELGKISVIAKGAKNPQSKFASHLEPGNITRFELSYGRSLYIVTAAKITIRYDFTNLASMRELFRWLEIIDKVTRPGQSQEDLFAIVERGIQAAAISPARQYLYELELYSTIGYQLELKQCVIGHEVLKQQGNVFNIRHGGIVCAHHASEVEVAFPITTEAIKVLRLIQQQEQRVLEKIVVSDILAHEMKKIAQAQRHEILEQDLKSEVLQEEHD